MTWFVLYTKPRTEKLVAERLRAMNVDVYCPLVTRRRQWSDRIKTTEEALFSCCCFVRLNEPERNIVFGVPGVVRYLFWLSKPAIVRDVEIESIKAMLDETGHQSIQVQALKSGDQLTIASGSFKNTPGTVVRQEGKIVTVVLNSMQMVLKVDLTTTAVSV